jgi:hypothetical protein
MASISLLAFGATAATAPDMVGFTRGLRWAGSGACAFWFCW